MNMENIDAVPDEEDRDTRYTYNGKEMNDDLGWLDYGARFYDPSIARFTQVDPLASSFSDQSTYQYVYNNPLRFIDPDGRSADDIIITAKRGDETNSKQRTFSELQSLTDDKLGFASDGKTVVILEQGDGTKTEGTGLIRDLISSSETTEITNDVSGVSIGGNKLNDQSLETNSFTIAENSTNASNGEGTGSKILFSPDTKAKFTNEKGGREVSKANTVLAHELIHSDNNRTGTREVGKPAQNPNFKSNREEEKTTTRENIIRKQMGQPLRGVGSHNH